MTLQTVMLGTQPETGNSLFFLLGVLGAYSASEGCFAMAVHYKIAFFTNDLELLYTFCNFLMRVHF